MATLLRKAVNVSTFGLLGKDRKKAKPASTQKRVMPIADDEAIRLAERKRIARKRARSGRAATILSGGGSSGSGFGG